MDWESLISDQAFLGQLPLPLRERALPMEVVAGQALARAGDRVHRLFAVLRGEVRLVRRDANGKDIVLQRSSGGFIAEASMSSDRYHCDLEVAAPGVLLSFPIRAFKSALDHDARFRDLWIKHLAREVRRLRAQCERLNLRHAADRILHYVESEGSDGILVLSCTRKAWAAELGLSHEAVYRSLAGLQASGVLRVEGGRIARR